MQMKEFMSSVPTEAQFQATELFANVPHERHLEFIGLIGKARAAGLPLLAILQWLASNITVILRILQGGVSLEDLWTLVSSLWPILVPPTPAPV